VWQVDARGAVRQRLLDMGLLPGARVAVERAAMAGDPIWIKLHGYQLSLRRAEAKAIRVQRVEGQV
jgi:Fe2+ transport system protein FeoA